MPSTSFLLGLCCLQKEGVPCDQTALRPFERLIHLRGLLGRLFLAHFFDKNFRLALAFVLR